MAVATQTTVEARPSANGPAPHAADGHGGGALAPATARAPRRLPTVLIILAVVAAAGVAYALLPGKPWSSKVVGGGTPLFRAARTRLPVTVDARGTIESALNREVVNRVEGQTMILYIIPDGTTVKKGDLVCELDSSALREKLTNELITIQQAEADVQNALKTREVAEFALREYEGGTYPQTRQNADITLTMARTNLSQADERYEWSTRMYRRGFVAKSQTVADRDAKANTEISLDRAKTTIHVLEEFTKRKQIIELQASVQKAKSDEMTKQAKLALERSKQKKYEGLVERCKMYAPADGLIVHANDAMGRRGSEQAMIQEGTTAREGQVLIRIPDVASMRVDAKVDESVISRIGPGQRARIRVDAFPGLNLKGSVTAVQPLADPMGRDAIDVRLYTAKVTIDGSMTQLRPGMMAKVEILVSEAEDLLAVPMKAVLQVGPENFVYVSTPDGMRRRAVRLGASNAELIEVVEGLQEGDVVSLDPVKLMSEREKREAFAAASPHLL
ncbi:efflux RND transporter periplasmic adaptor subunit [Paludisphaera soli]|uniref:efflux RND transporter periplasmic adaptor subunit n=1 Tax=Paludisphaera soli TaxID=2712865 RepID=UPI0013EA994F|nr:efflux RND transporter periplasmic adaptor subunit [Paludisphaera soli]